MNLPAFANRLVRGAAVLGLTGSLLLGPGSARLAVAAPAAPSGPRVVTTLPASAYPTALLPVGGDQWWLAVPAAQGPGALVRLAPGPATSTFPLTGSSQPFDLTIGPDGQVWFSDRSGNRLARRDAAGEVTGWDLPGETGSPTQVLNAQDGQRVWYTDFEHNRVGWVALDGSQQVYPLPTANSRPLGLALDLDGNLWFTEWNTNRLGKVDLDGQLSEVQLPAVPARPAELILGPDNCLWFTYDRGSAVGRYDLSSGQSSVYTLATASTTLSDLAVGPDGRIWFVGFQTVGSFRLGSAGPENLVEYPLDQAVFEAQGRSQIAAGPDGELNFITAASRSIYTLPATGSNWRDVQLFLDLSFIQTVLAGGNFTIGVVARNWSGSAATDQVMLVDLPVGLTYVAVDGSSGPCIQDEQLLACPLPDLPGDSQQTITLTLGVARTDVISGPQRLNFAIIGDQADYQPANNHLYVAFEVRQSLDFAYDFSQEPGSVWSHQTRTDPDQRNPRLGAFSNENVRLTLKDLSPHDSVLFCYDLTVTGPWDGAQLLDPANEDRVIGPDLWANYLDDRRLRVTTFSNQPNLAQSFPADYPTGLHPAGSSVTARGDFNGDGVATDSRYSFCFVEPHSQRELRLTFYGAGLNPQELEQWSIDNVTVHIYYQAAYRWIYLPNVNQSVQGVNPR